MTQLSRMAVLILGCLFAASALAQTTVTLQQGQNNYLGTTDSWIVGNGPTQNKGTDALSLRAESTDSAMVRFKIFAAEGGPVPDGATINAATLSLYKFGGFASTIKASRLLKNWNEAQVTWNVAATGTPWTTPGALGSGTDYVATADGQASIGDANTDGCDVPDNSPGVQACWLNINVTSGVQAFSGNPLQNFGWKIAEVSSSTPGNFKNFDSKDMVSRWPALVPKLTITYTTNTTPPSGTTATMTQGINGYTGTTDSWMVGNGPDQNRGTDGALSIRQESTDSAMVRFKIFAAEGGPVPNGATITSATLSLYKFGGAPSVVKASRLKKDWNEAQVTWNVAATGAPWTTPGALGSGSDFESTPDAQVSTADSTANGCSTTASEACWARFNVTTGVQAFAGGAPNFGWKIAEATSSTPGNFKNFTSSNSNSAATFRPTLAVTYTGGGTPCTAPTAHLAATFTPGAAPLNVTFSASGSTDGSAPPITSLRLQFGDGTPDAVWSDKAQPQAHTYTTNGPKTATLTVSTSGCGPSAPVSQTIQVEPPAGTGEEVTPNLTSDAGELGFSVPTFHSMSLYYNPGVPANCTTSNGSGCKIWMRYRKATEPNTAWREGYPLWFDPRTTDGNTNPVTNTLPFKTAHPVSTNVLEYRARGSAVLLQPATKYFFQFGTGTTFAGANWQHHVAGTTWSETFPENTVVTTIPSQTATYIIPANGGGTPTSYKVYDGWNGTSKNVINRQGQGTMIPHIKNVDPFLPALDPSHGIVVKASYVIVRRVRTTGTAIAGISIAPNVTDVVIEDTEIDDFTYQPGDCCDKLGHSNPNSWGTWGWNEAGGIYLAGNNSRIVMQRNIIKEPHLGAFPWDTGFAANVKPNNHPIGPMGISIQQAGQQNVIRYNEITGDPTDKNKWYLDGIGGGENVSDKGVPGADSDIYQNIIMHVFDDAIEAEGGGRNVRIWGNYMTDSKTAVAATVAHFGPHYVWRNVSNRQRTRHQSVTDPAADWSATAFKYTGWDSLTGGLGYGDGIRYLFHNTILQEPGAFGAGVGVEANANGANSTRWTITRNNIFHVRSNTLFSIDPGDTAVGSDFERDVYNGRLNDQTTAGNANVPIEPTSTTPLATYMFDNSGTQPQLFYKNTHGFSSVPALGGNGTGNYQLDTNSKGLNVGEVIPNFSDGFIGSAPDAGAHENGAPPMKFGISAGQ